MLNLIEELRWRGLLHDHTPGTEAYLAEGMGIGYVGFDPSADSLHIGNMIPIMMLAHLQRAGHKPIALVGGATGMIGDPSGKSVERNLLGMDELAHNTACIQAQLEKFLDFNCGEKSAEIVNNYDWFKEISFLDFIRDTGKHITVNYMLAKDSVKNRLETGMSFTEFTYQLVQGYDFYHLYKNKNVKLQLGGSDQFGNIVTGTELIRRKEGGEAFAITAPLVTKADGTKFGKSESGNVWLDAKKTSPYKFYQFWMNINDEDAPRYLRLFTFMDKQAIDSLTQEHAASPHLRLLQKELAKQFTTRVHSEEDYHKAVRATDILFGKATKEALNALSEEEILEIFEGVPQFQMAKSKVDEGLDMIEFLSEFTSILPSKSEARRQLQANSMSINQEKVNAETKVNSAHLLNGKYMLVQKGKKEYFLVAAS